VIRGGTSNKAFLLELLRRPEVVLSEADNAWLDGFAARGEHVNREHADVALLAVALDAYNDEAALEQARFFTSAARGRPKVGDAVGFETELGYRGARYAFSILRAGPSSYRVDAGTGVALEVREDHLGRRERRITVGGRAHRVISIADGLDHLVEVGGVPHRVSRDAAGTVRAHSPAVVLRVPVKKGDLVSAGDPVIVLEAMKMEMTVAAPMSGRVREVFVTPNVHVDAAAALLVIDPLAEAAPADESPSRIAFTIAPPAPPTAGDAREKWQKVREVLERLLLGYDVDAAAASRITATWKAACAALPPADPDADPRGAGAPRCLRRRAGALPPPPRRRPGRRARQDEHGGAPVRVPPERRLARRGPALRVPRQAVAGARALRREQPGADARAA
jgi:biotin carboxyl carrier protein